MTYTCCSKRRRHSKEIGHRLPAASLLFTAWYCSANGSFSSHSNDDMMFSSENQKITFTAALNYFHIKRRIGWNKWYNLQIGWLISRIPILTSRKSSMTRARIGFPLYCRSTPAASLRPFASYDSLIEPWWKIIIMVYRNKVLNYWTYISFIFKANIETWCGGCAENLNDFI